LEGKPLPPELQETDCELKEDTHHSCCEEDNDGDEVEVVEEVKLGKRKHP
jgi:hypothetical protein